MEKERTICPLRLIAHAAEQSRARDVNPYCTENKCAWWNKDHRCCAVKALTPEYVGEAD
jgi:hypothetical protein